MKNFTDRETEILKEVVNGESNKDIAKKLYLSQSTVKVYVSSIMRKFNVQNRVGVAVEGFKYIYDIDEAELKAVL
ncbi:response regulator transcription factor [bacterium]|nr:response regulator transcription factor [bacterium]